MKKIFFAAPLFLLLAVAAFAEVSVISALPQGVLAEASADNTITVSFNKPIAVLSAQTQLDGAACPIMITPAVQGSCRWLGTQTLTFTPAAPLPPATAFSVTLSAAALNRAGAQEPLANDYTWQFQTPFLSITRSLPDMNEAWLGTTPKMMIAFNYPVELNTLLNYVRLYTKDGVVVPIRVGQLTKQLYDEYFKYSDTPLKNIFFMEPAAPLGHGKDYALILKQGLTPAGGSAGMPNNYILPFSTYGDLAFIRPPQSKCLPFLPALEFTNPVTVGEIAKNITFSPAVNFKPCDENNSGYPTEIRGVQSRAYEIGLCGLEFKPSQTYKVTISGNLKDIFGQKLGRDISFDWSNQGYCPSVDFKGGFGVIESELKPYHPASAVNVEQISVQKKKIEYTDFIPFYKKFSSAYCDSVKLEGSFITKIWTPTLKKDEGVNSFIDLSPALLPLKSGIVFAQFLKPFKQDNDNCWQKSLDNVTNIGLSIKTSPQDILVWATYLKDGKPAAKKEVELRNADNKIIWQGKTNGDGVAIAPGWSKLDIVKEEWGSPEIWAFVKDGDNIAVISGNFNEGIQPWRFNLNYSYEQKAENIKAFIFTERGIYRTGEEVHIKAVIRQIKEGKFAAADKGTAKLTITDPAGKEVASKDLNISGLGDVSYVYQIPVAAPTGYYDVKLEAGGESFSQNFRAEAVKPAEFKVQLTALAKQYFAGDKADFALSAQYLFGAALGGAKTDWTIKIVPSYFSPQGWEGYGFLDYEALSKAAEQPVLQQSSVLDDKGNGKISAVLPKVSFPATLYAQAGVLSPQNQQLFARRTVDYLPSNIFIGVKVPNGIALGGQPFTLDIVTTDYEGKLAPSSALQGTLIRKEYLSVRKTGVSGRLEWVSNEQEEEVSKFSLNNETGKASWTFTPSKAGSYLLKLKTADRQGRVNTNATSFYVSAEGETYWQQQDDDILQLVADKEQYQPGDKAKILIKSPFKEGYALVTVEREGILYTDTIKVKGGAKYVKIPIEDSFTPNVFVSIVLVQGRSGEGVYNKQGEDIAKPQAKFGYVSLSVPPAQHKLTPVITTDKTNYEPGQKATVSVQVNNVKGKGQKATVTLYAVDEGMLALSAYTTPDIFSYFYQIRPLAVSTADNRLFLIGQRSFGQKGENRGGGGSDSKLGGIDLRNNFKFVPFYSAEVNTDKKGMASLSFTVPDNLTKFRIMAVAAAQDSFGSGEAVIEVSKPVMIKPFLPRFARLGDSFACGFIVYNYTKEENLKTAVLLKAEGGVTFSGAVPASVSIPAGQSVTVKGTCTANSFKDTVFSFAAQNTKGTDGLKVTLPVLPTGEKRTFAAFGATQNKAEETLGAPTDGLAALPSSVDFSLGASVALNAKAAVDYLNNYPYYCLEQRLSKLTPYIFGGDILAQQGIAYNDEVKKTVQQSIDKASDYQTAYGGFNYWPSTKQADPYITAYALDVLYAADKAGFNVDKQMVAKAVKWLGNYVSSADKNTAYAYSEAEGRLSKAYGVYALALYGDNNAGAYFSNLFADRKNLNIEGKLYLLKAAVQLKREAALNTLKTEVLNYLKQSNATAYFESPRNMWIYSDNVKVTSLGLEALLNAGGFAADFKTANWLNNYIKQRPDYGNTTNNALAFRALSAYVKAKEAQEPAFTAEVQISGKQAAAAFNGRNAPSKDISFAMADIFGKKKTAKAQISKQGTGTLYYRAALNYYAKPSSSAQNAGFGVFKNFAFTGQASAAKPDAKTAADLASLISTKMATMKAGQMAIIKITVNNPQDRSFVVLEDALPAGLEVIDTSLATEMSEDIAAPAQTEDGEEAEESYAYNPFNRVENYDDRVVAFADYLPKGVYVFNYKVRATAAGKYALPSAKVSQMYEPEVFGAASGGGVLLVNEK